jgi:5-(carboxyamino)imidazole ribonucleotide mutase
MSNPHFLDLLRRRVGCAVVVAGSDSDRKHVERIVEALRAWEVPCEVRICSAHKSPDRLLRIIGEYESEGAPLAYVAVAGGTDALSGTLSFHTSNPVISCPPDPPNASCLSNPPGSSNATIYDPRNVARFIAQIYAPFNSVYREKLLRSRGEKIKQLETKDEELRLAYRSVNVWEA